MGIGNNCTKHSVPGHTPIPEKFKVILGKIGQLNDAPMGRVIDTGKCPICIYKLGYEDGKKSSG